MINNRQGGRRRGRGGQRGQSLGGQPGNRQDNRQRGNAAQLLEKYKSMARDSQLAGDRVQTEYFLQFADHYFRVLGENRSRFEEQNPRRQRDDEMDEDDGDGEEDFAEAAESETAGNDERSERPDRASRPARADRSRDRDRERPRFNREERSANNSDEQSAPRLNGAGDSLPLDVLPPAIGRDDAEAAAASDDEPRRPRRRTRTPRPADDEGDIAPAA